MDPLVHNTLIVLYSLVIILGIIGNAAILLAFLANKVMLTTRNIFIANLAISDILLCSFTMPLTLVDLLTRVNNTALHCIDTDSVIESLENFTKTYLTSLHQSKFEHIIVLRIRK